MLGYIFNMSTVRAISQETANRRAAQLRDLASGRRTQAQFDQAVLDAGGRLPDPETLREVRRLASRPVIAGSSQNTAYQGVKVAPPPETAAAERGVSIGGGRAAVQTDRWCLDRQQVNEFVVYIAQQLGML